MKTILDFIAFGLFTLSSVVSAGGNHSGTHDHHDKQGSHKHDSWFQPPDAYSGKSWNQWQDKALAKKGRDLYQQQCVSCHGVSGKGDGLLAHSLAHQPADLTHHFHLAQGNGDDYLYWRISEGGTVAPFNKMQSAMPAFKDVLSESERWAVLTYVHQAFHGGFKTKQHEISEHNHK